MVARLKSQVTWLGAAGLVEYGLQLLVPVLLVRQLDVESFGLYRFCWLIAGTALAVLPFYVPQSLYYFLPRARDATERAALLANTLGYIMVVGVAAAAAVVALGEWGPERATELWRVAGWLGPVFIALWVCGSWLETAPTACDDATWQAKFVLASSAMRAALVALASTVSGSLVAVLVALVGISAARVGGAAWYLYRRQRSRIGAVDTALMSRQLAYSAPFAVGTMLFLLRSQSDMWIVATACDAASFAAFAQGGTVLAVNALVRQPVIWPLLGRMNVLHTRGDIAGIVELVRRSNLLTAAVLWPLAGWLWVCAPQLVELLYTEAYLDAAPVMRIYLIAVAFTAVAAGHLLALVARGEAAVFINAAMLLMSVAGGVLGVTTIGPPGAAVGSTIALILGESIALRIVAGELRASAAALLDVVSLARVAAPVALAMGAATATPAPEGGVWATLSIRSAMFAVVLCASAVATGALRRVRSSSG